jgi:hypothetical protein
VSLDKGSLANNGFNVQVSLRAERANKKKTNFRVVLPLMHLIVPEFVHAERFGKVWQTLENELYLSQRRLDTEHFRSYEDLKLILPFVEVPRIRFSAELGGPGQYLLWHHVQVPQV